MKGCGGSSTDTDSAILTLHTYTIHGTVLPAAAVQPCIIPQASTGETSFLTHAALPSLHRPPQRDECVHLCVSWTNHTLRGSNTDPLLPSLLHLLHLLSSPAGFRMVSRSGVRKQKHTHTHTEPLNAANTPHTAAPRGNKSWEQSPVAALTETVS